MKSSISDALWGEDAKLSYLLIAALVILFAYLGAREIWTQEHRWADIVSGMFYRNDFLHPYLGETRYYDKPLLSYWLIAIVAYVAGGLATWVLRFPSALAGFLAVWSIYSLGTRLKDQHLGFLSGWMLLTTFYFVFWARTSSADMLNMAGVVIAVAWYFNHREKSNFYTYSVFFLILALTALCKGLVGAVVPVLAVITDLCLQKSWKKHLNLSLFLALIPAMVIYLFPFWLSSYYDGDSYGQNGLYLVYRENFLRYFDPFDHKGPIYTYFIYLPIYLLPWTLFFIPAVFSLINRWKTLSLNSKWICWTVLVLFLFFTLSGSRRSYYVLPIVPFAILLTADWILSAKTEYSWRNRLAGVLAIVTTLLIYVGWDILPYWYYSKYGVNRFAQVLQHDAGEIMPWPLWNVVMLDAESKLSFYLQLPPDVKNYHVLGVRNKQTSDSLAMAWPILRKKPKDTIFITRAMYAPLLAKYFKDYIKVQLPEESSLPFLKNHEINAPVAYIPKPSR